MTSSPASSSSSRAKGCPWVTRCPATAKLPISSGERRAGVVTHAAVEERQVRTGQDRHLVVGSEGGDPQQRDGVARDHGRRELAFARRARRNRVGVLGRLRPLCPAAARTPRGTPSPTSRWCRSTARRPSRGTRDRPPAGAPRPRSAPRSDDADGEGSASPPDRRDHPSGTGPPRHCACSIDEPWARLDSSSMSARRLVSRSRQPARRVPLLGRPRLDQPADDATRRCTPPPDRQAPQELRLGRSGSAPSRARPPRRSGRGWLIALIAVAVVLVVLVVLAVRGLGGVLGGLPGVPGGDPSADVCPKPEASSTPTPQPNDGRVHSGPLSYPQLPSPWGAPEPNTEVPFGRDVLQQFVQTEKTSRSAGAPR